MLFPSSPFLHLASHTEAGGWRENQDSGSERTGPQPCFFLVRTVGFFCARAQPPFFFFFAPWHFCAPILARRGTPTVLSDRLLPNGRPLETRFQPTHTQRPGKASGAFWPAPKKFASLCFFFFRFRSPSVSLLTRDFTFPSACERRTRTDSSTCLRKEGKDAWGGRACVLTRRRERASERARRQRARCCRFCSARALVSLRSPPPLSLSKLHLAGPGPGSARIPPTPVRRAARSKRRSPQQRQQTQPSAPPPQTLRAFVFFFLVCFLPPLFGALGARPPFYFAPPPLFLPRQPHRHTHTHTHVMERARAVATATTTTTATRMHSKCRRSILVYLFLRPAHFWTDKTKRPVYSANHAVLHCQTYEQTTRRGCRSREGQEIKSRCGGGGGSARA